MLKKSGGSCKGNGEPSLALEGGCDMLSGLERATLEKVGQGRLGDCPDERFDGLSREGAM